MKINIGSGNRREEGVFSCDVDPKTNPDYCFDLEKDVFPFADDSIDGVLAHHILEHLGDGFFHCLQELYRVCKHGSYIDILSPHPRHYQFLADPTHKRAIMPEGLMLFSKKYNEYHKDSSASQLGVQYDVDFEIVSSDEIPDPKYLQAFNSMKTEEAQRYIHEHNNIVMQYHIRLVVVKE